MTLQAENPVDQFARELKTYLELVSKFKRRRNSKTIDAMVNELKAKLQKTG